MSPYNQAISKTKQIAKKLFIAAKAYGL